MKTKTFKLQMVKCEKANNLQIDLTQHQYKKIYRKTLNQESGGLTPEKIETIFGIFQDICEEWK